MSLRQLFAVLFLSVFLIRPLQAEGWRIVLNEGVDRARADELIVQYTKRGWLGAKSAPAVKGNWTIYLGMFPSEEVAREVLESFRSDVQASENLLLRIEAESGQSAGLSILLGSTETQKEAAFLKDRADAAGVLDSIITPSDLGFRVEIVNLPDRLSAEGLLGEIQSLGFATAVLEDPAATSISPTPTVPTPAPSTIPSPTAAVAASPAPTQPIADTSAPPDAIPASGGFDQKGLIILFAAAALLLAGGGLLLLRRKRPEVEESTGGLTSIPVEAPTVQGDDLPTPMTIHLPTPTLRAPDLTPLPLRDSRESEAFIPPVSQITPLPAMPPPETKPQPYRRVGLVTNPPPIALQPGSQSSDGDDPVLFTQDFDNETIGAFPSGWKGEESMAIMRVIEGGPGLKRTNCLEFKHVQSNGVGSVRLTRRVPTGEARVKLEFDFRCEDLNHLLVGFYFEHEDDFTRSIQTEIIRKSSETFPSLRLCGETVPYEFGTWIRLRFQIDLEAATVDIWVDGVFTFKKIKLKHPPRKLNNLTIRCNANSTATVLIDNIRITKLKGTTAP